jgi:hypothetical protein
MSALWNLILPCAFEVLATFCKLILSAALFCYQGLLTHKSKIMLLVVAANHCFFLSRFSLKTPKINQSAYMQIQWSYFFPEVIEKVRKPSK